MNIEILRYRSTLAYNREVFLIEHSVFVKAFSEIDDNFANLIDHSVLLLDSGAMRQ